VGILEERRHLGNLGLDGRIIENLLKKIVTYEDREKQ